MTAETEIVLANLDWLIEHEGMKLDYGARCVRDERGECAHLLDDLAALELTPAGRRLAGRLPLAICTAAAYDGVLG